MWKPWNELGWIASAKSEWDSLTIEDQSVLQHAFLQAVASPHMVAEYQMDLVWLRQSEK